MAAISMSAATRRNTKCYRVSVGDLTVTFSYQTIIGASFRGQRMRRNNDWGRTTGRHINESSVRDYPVVSEEELEKFIERSLATQALSGLFGRFNLESPVLLDKQADEILSPA